MKTEKYAKSVMGVLLLILAMFITTAAHSQKWEKSRDVIEGYVGWENNPDSLNVYIDDTWTGAEKDSVRAAMQRWNDAGCEPKFREVSNADDAQITIEKGELEEGDKGQLERHRNDDGKMTSGKITIAGNHNEPPNPLSIKEIVTHELGHAIGLADTDEVANPSDVMKGSGPSNGSDGGLSAHDSTQMRTAMLCITIPGEESIPKEKAEDLPGGMPFTPGDFGTLIFPLPYPYPPGTEALVVPVENDLITVEVANLIGDQLHVGLYFDPDHWSGTFYLDIILFPPLEPPYNFWGYYFINQHPVSGTTFECPFTIEQEGSTVLVDWVSSHNYPHANPLRATLAVDGNIFYTKRPTGNFHLDLPAGEYFFELYVDDFQGNSASFGMDVFVNPQMPGDLFLRPGIKTYPEPWYAWIGGVNDQTMVQLFASDPDDQIQEVLFYYNTDMTSPNWTWFYTDNSGFSYAVPGPNTEYDGIADGWAGYLSHALVAQDIAVPLFFKAEIHTGSGMVLEVLSETTLTWDPMPPFAFELNLEDGFITDQDFITASIIPEHGNFDYAVFNVSAKPEVFTKSIPFVQQQDLMSCVPYALAACLKFFASKGYDGIDGGLDIIALAEALKPYVKYNSEKGTQDDDLASGAQKWIDEHGGGFKVTGPLPYSKFNTTLMRDKSEGDSLLNGIPQNIIPLFQWDSIDPSGKTHRPGHAMTLSSVHNTPEEGKRRFDFMDPGNGITVWGDIDEETGECSGFDDNYPPNGAEVFSTIMICPTEPSPNPTGGGTITQGPELPPVEVPMPDSGGVVIRTRAVNQNGHKSERDVTGTRVRPATYPPGDTAVILGGPPFQLDGGLPSGGNYSGPGVIDGWFHPIDEGIHLITYSYTYPMGFVTSCNFTIIVNAMDFGDAPDPYPTLLIDDGARHIIVSELYLGQLVDPEPDGQPCQFALGDDQDGTDDEDGVVLPDYFLPGKNVDIGFTVVGSGFINGWFDWDANGSWADAGDHAIVNWPVTTGVHVYSLPVPITANTGYTFARFRFSSEQDLSYVGLAPDGEVEDYMLKIAADFGDAPDQAVAYIGPNAMLGNFPTCKSIPTSGWIQHSTTDAYFGLYFDYEFDGNADSCLIFAANYNQDECFGGDAGLIKPGSFTISGDPGNEIVYPCPGSTDSILGPACGYALWGEDIDIFVVNLSHDPVYFNLLIDWNQDGNWQASADCDDGGQIRSIWEHVVINKPVPANYSAVMSGLLADTLWIGPNPGYVWARFSLTDEPVVTGWDGSGIFLEGETEDYLLLIGEPELLYLDFGDAPDPPYPSYTINDGARHYIDYNVYLGEYIDGETGAQPTPLADGDDINGVMDDEDGVTFLWPVAAGNPCKVMVTASVSTAFLNAWFDFNQNGSWNDPEDQIFNDLMLQAGGNYLNFIAPASVTNSGLTFTRFRYSHDVGLLPTGVATDGEVEDYIIEVEDLGEIKWQQLPEQIHPGLHCHDWWTQISGSWQYDQITLYDDWLCAGDPITKIQWWGNYEVEIVGNDTLEIRGDGIKHFSLSIYANDPISCQPGNLLWTSNVPFTEVNESFIGLYNNEYSKIYLYEYNFPPDGPFLQTAGERYWLGLTAVSVPPPQPLPHAIWRWQEASRSITSILCPAATWDFPYPLPDKYSDMAFRLNSFYTPDESFDYGDAPEGALAYPATGVIGQFPTCKNVGNPDSYIQHNVFGAYFGLAVDSEPDGNAGFCPLFNPDHYDRDECFNDGDAGLIIPEAFTITGPVGSEIVVPCMDTPASSIGNVCTQAVWGTNIDILVHNFMPGFITAYVNVIIDWNQDGMWGGSSSCGDGLSAAEHVLVNFPVPYGHVGPLSDLSPPPFLIGPNSGYVWVRFTITDTPVPEPDEGWDGSGIFGGGETEDYLLHVLPVQDLNLQYQTIPGGTTVCFDAANTITTGGSGTTFIVQNNAIVYLIAGYSVNMLPGTHFQSGSQVHAYIDLSGEFCTNPKAMVVDEEPVPELLPLEFDDKESFFRVYPNPNTGQFTLELREVSDHAVISVEIFSLIGETVMKLELPEMKQYLFDLSARQPGVYLIRVMKGDDVGVEKLIKH